MTKRILIGGIVGGLIMFIWGFLSHTVLMLGDAGLKSIEPAPSDAFAAAAKAAFKESGLYYFPHYDWQAVMKLPKEQREAADKAYGEKVKNGPSGMVVYVSSKPEGTDMSRELAGEFATNVVTCLILALLLSQLKDSTRYSCRVCFCATVGLLAGIAVNVPQWNWYKYPGVFSAAQVADHTIGFALVGLFLAWLMKPAAAAVPAPAVG